MTDEEFVLKQTNKERSQMKNGAYHRKSGSKSKSCRLPSDYLSKKEKLALNGPVQSWSMDKLYSWDEFKNMPKDIQEAWLTAICGKYRIGLTTIDRELFGHPRSTAIWNYIKYHDLHPNIVKVNGPETRRAAEEFRKIIKRVNDIPDESNNKQIEQEHENTYNVISATITTDGFDDNVFNTLKLIFANKKVKVTISVCEG